jgi:hypothetical protein
MRKPGTNRKEGIEAWIDERIQFAFSGLTHPFEKRIKRLRERIEKLQVRVRKISEQVDQDPDQGQSVRKHSGKQKS